MPLARIPRLFWPLPFFALMMVISACSPGIAAGFSSPGVPSSLPMTAESRLLQISYLKFLYILFRVTGYIVPRRVPRVLIRFISRGTMFNSAGDDDEFNNSGLSADVLELFVVVTIYVHVCED